MHTQTETTSQPVAPTADGQGDQLAITTLRLLAADAIEAAGSGHPGLPLGMAPAAWVLWSRFLRFDPTEPEWVDRDRFVLSAGHGSALLYGLLHLCGFDLPLSEIRRFRQWGSLTPGHPEHGLTPGVEVTTGPLGQGLATAVGLALAERLLAADLNDDPAAPVVDHRTFVLASDGDLMEGISHEAASLAGHLGLGRLIVLYDDNDITIDGATSIACSDNVDGRFRAYGWDVRTVADGNDLRSVDDALRRAIARDDRPSLIRVHTTIGFGAPDVAGTPAAHGAPLGAGQLRRTKLGLGADPDHQFHVPDPVVARRQRIAASGRRTRLDWESRYAAWRSRNPGKASSWRRVRARELPPNLLAVLPSFPPGGSLATRSAFGEVLRATSAVMPELVGGSADLAASTKTSTPSTTDVTRKDQHGRRINFGIREHAMAAVCNGLSLHGGFRPYGATFAVFSDYARPAIRLGALMAQPVIHVFTHDSIAVGEDGPTHQPIEQLTALRIIPGLAVLRPADANETTAAWAVALSRTDGPTALFLSRQDLPVLDPPPPNAIAEDGAWVVRDGGTTPDVTLVAAGAEVSLALEAADLVARGPEPLAARVVSMPWREQFLRLAPERRHLLLGDAPRVVVEAGVRDGWEDVRGPGGAIVALDRFGASAPGEEVMSRLGFSPPAIADLCRRVATTSKTGGPHA